MEANRREEMKAILREIALLPQAERQAYVDSICAENETLRSELQPYLEVTPEMEAFFDESVLSTRTPGFPKLLGPYRIREEIGHGGMGIVYAAEREDGTYQRRVAVKVLKQGMVSEETVKRFDQERQILAKLSHPNIATLFDGGTTVGGRPFLVMEYVEGESLHSFCRKQQLTLEERLRLFKKICGAVHEAHQNLVIHRDLKPGNMIVAPGGEPKLLDFGIAKLLDPLFHGDPDDALTQIPVMTLQYASPEQIQGDPITTASDIYALGVILCELLTGKRPYHLDLPAREAICTAPPLKPSTLLENSDDTRKPRIGLPYNDRHKLRGDLDHIILKALRKEPHKRYGSVEQLSNDITRFQENLPIQSAQKRPLYHLQKWIRRRKGVALALLVISLLIVGFAVVLAQKQVEFLREYAQSQKLSAFLGEMFTLTDPHIGKDSSLTVEEFLDRALINLDIGSQTEIDYQVNILQIIGNSYLKLGIYDKAESTLELAVELCRNHPEIHAKELAGSLYLLGYLYHRVDRKPKDEVLLREAAQLQKKVLGKNNPEYAQTLATLGSALAKSQQWQEAEDHLLEALTILGEAHQEYAMVLNSLGSCYKQAGRYQDAEKVYQRVIAFNDAYYPDAKARPELNNLGQLYKVLGKLSQAEGLLRRAWEHDARFHGEDHPFVLIIRANLAGVKYAQGSYEEAEKMQRQIVAVREKNNLPLTWSLNNLARTCMELGHLDEAEELYQRALSGLQNQAPFATMVLRSNLAEIYKRSGEFTKAETLLRQAQELALAKFGLNHPHYAKALYGLGEIYRLQGEIETAWPLHLEALKIRKAKLPADHHEIGSSYLMLAKMCQSKGDFEEAFSHSSNAVAILEKASGADHFKTQSAKAFHQQLLMFNQTQLP